MFLTQIFHHFLMIFKKDIHINISWLNWTHPAIIFELVITFFTYLACSQKCPNFCEEYTLLLLFANLLEVYGLIKIIYKNGAKNMNEILCDTYLRFLSTF